MIYGKIITKYQLKYRENVQGNNEYIYITKDNYIEEFGEMVEYENSSDMNVFKVD